MKLPITDYQLAMHDRLAFSNGLNRESEIANASFIANRQSLMLSGGQL